MRTWKTEHGDAYAVPPEILGMVERGVLFDQSWHNDACPSFFFTAEPDADDLMMWADHPDHTQREVHGLGQFTLCHGGKDINTTEDLTTTMAHILAVQFAKVLTQWLGTVAMKLITVANESIEGDCCATHDHCDSNMAMEEAFEAVVGRESICCGDEDMERHTADINLINQAWGIAKAAGFPTYGLK